METIITKEYLRKHPYEVFVFGDNLTRRGLGGAAALREEPNTYGFVTKKAPTNNKGDYYKPDEYEKVFYKELDKLIARIKENTDYTYLISKLGAGLANKYFIWENVIQPKLRKLLSKYENVRFLYDDEDEKHLHMYGGYISVKGKLVIYRLADEEELEDHLKMAKEAKALLEPLKIVKELSIEEAIKTYKLLLEIKHDKKY